MVMKYLITIIWKFLEKDKYLCALSLKLIWDLNNVCGINNYIHIYINVTYVYNYKLRYHIRATVVGQ